MKKQEICHRHEMTCDELYVSTGAPSSSLEPSTASQAAINARREVTSFKESYLETTEKMNKTASH